MTEPTLAGLLDRLVANVLSQLFVARPARVEAYDHESQTVDVTPVLKEVIEAGDETRVIDLPPIDKVPLCWPRAGKWFLAAPLSKGDYVLLIHADRSIDVWQERGGVVDPIDLRRHDITDAIAIPGVYPKPDALTEGGLDTDLVLGQQGGSVVRIMPDGTIELGATDAAKQAVALADDVRAELDAIKSDLDTLNGHEHSFSGVTSNGGTFSGSTMGGPSTSYSPNDVGSSKVFAEE